MHSHARTLLAKMGFADADRKSPRHDLACIYIALRKNILMATIQAAMPGGVTVEDASAELEFQFSKGEGKYSTTVGWVDVWAQFRARQPSLMAAPAYWTYNQPDGETRRLLMGAPRHNASVSLATGAVIEVKIGAVGAGDLVRQMRLYDQHRPDVAPRCEFRTEAPNWTFRCSIDDVDKCKHGDPVNAGYFKHHREHAWDRLGAAIAHTMVVCCDYDIDAEYVRTLKSAGIQAIRLGAGFESFVREQSESTERVELLAI